MSNLRRDLQGVDEWIISGSVAGWGDALIPEFTVVIFLYVPWEERKRRLIGRDVERYGQEAILPGGWRYEAHEAFLDWASKYDSAGMEMRSRKMQEAWLERIPCQVIRVEGEYSEAELLRLVVGEM